MCSKEAKGRGRHRPPSIWAGHLQDAGQRVGLRQEWPGPGEADVPVERGRFVAKAAQGPAPRLQLLHGDSAWLKDQLARKGTPERCRIDQGKEAEIKQKTLFLGDPC